MYLIKWIDRELEYVKTDIFFDKYFSGIGIKEYEGLNYLSNHSKGIEIVLSDVLMVQSIHLFSGENGSDKIYKGQIPNNVNFSMPRLVVKKLLGEPDKSGGGYKDIFGDIPHWDKFFFETYSLHLQYSPKNNVDLITIGSLSLEAYFNIGLQ